MKYILNNPTFKNEPVEIGNIEAIKLIESYVNRPKKLILGDEILIAISGVIIRLELIEFDEEKYVFNQVPNKWRG